MEGREETRTRAERAGAERRRERSSSRRSLGERKVSALSFSTSASASSSCLSSESSSRVRTRTFFICRRVIFLKEARGREGEGGGIERGRQKNGKKNDFTPLLFPFFSLLLVSLSQVCSFFVEEREDAVVFVFLESSLAVDDAAARSSRPSTRRCRCRRLVDAAVAVTVAANFAAFLLLFPPAVAFPPRLFPPRVRHGEIISKRGLREHGRDRSLVPGREVRSLMFPRALVFFETSARSLAAGQKKKTLNEHPLVITSTKTGSAPRPRPRPSSPSGPPRSPRGPSRKPASSEQGRDDEPLPPSASSPARSAPPSRASRSRSAACRRSRRSRCCGRRCRGRSIGTGRRGWRGTSWTGARGGRCSTSSGPSSVGAAAERARRELRRRRSLRLRRRRRRQRKHLPPPRPSSSSRETRPRRSSNQTPSQPRPQ